MAKKPRTRKPKTLSDQLRAVIDASELSRYEICRRSNVNEAALSRFMAGKDITTLTLDRLGMTLGLDLTQRGGTTEE